MEIHTLPAKVSIFQDNLPAVG